jgi:large subunit ribosomal protein L1
MINIKNAIEQALTFKGKRKFLQKVDLAVNFERVDFKKPENRPLIEIELPHAPSNFKVAVFAEGQIAAEAKKYADLVISGAEIQNYVNDKKKQKDLLKYQLLSAPQLMTVVGKQLGQFLGSKGKLPKPIPPNVDLKNFIEKYRKTVFLRSKGKYLPVLHCLIGNENMSVPEINDNASAVLDVLNKKYSETSISSVYVKLTMGKAFKA